MGRENIREEEKNDNLNIEKFLGNIKSVGMYHCVLGESIHMEYVNEEFCDFTGYTREEIIQNFRDEENGFDIIYPEDKDIYKSLILNIKENTGKKSAEYRIICKDGRIKHLAETIEYQMGQDGNIHGYSTVKDISTLKEKLNVLEEQQNRYEELCRKLKENDYRTRMISNYTGVFIFEFDLENSSFLSVDNVERLLGYNDEEMLAIVQDAVDHDENNSHFRLYVLIHPDDISIIEEDTEELKKNKESHCEIRMRRKNGSYIWCILYRFISTDEKTHHKRLIGCTINNDREHHQTEALRSQLTRDSMTDLFNKNSAFALISKILQDRELRRHAMLIVDVDNFKSVNDQFGHRMGDKILIDIADKLRTLFRSSDVLARFGGDEFLIFMPDITSNGLVRQKSTHLISIIQNEIGLLTTGIDISASVGIAFSEAGIGVEELFGRADKALYYSKHKGKACFSIYDELNDNVTNYTEREFIERSVNGGISIFKVNPDWLEVFYYSESLLYLLGYSKDDFKEVEQKDAWEMVFINDLEGAKSSMTECVESGKQQDLIFRLQKKDGKTIWVQTLAQRVGFEDECPIVHVVFNNISKHISLYSNMLEGSDQIIHLTDMKSFEIYYANSAAARAAGREEGSYVGKKCYEWLSHEHSQCQDCQIDKIRSDGMCRDEQFVEKGGSYFLKTGRAMELQGRKVFVEYVNDVTDIKEAQDVLNRQKEELNQRHERLKKTYDEMVNSFLSMSDGYLSLMQFDLTEDRLLEIKERDGNSYKFNIDMTGNELNTIVSSMIDSAEDQRILLKNMNIKKLLKDFEDGKTVNEFEIILNLERRGVKSVTFITTMRKEPYEDHIIAFIRVVDSSKERFSSGLLQKLQLRNYDKVGVLDANSGKYFSYNENMDVEDLWNHDYYATINKYFATSAVKKDNEFRKKFELDYILNELKKYEVYEIYADVRDNNGSVRNKKIDFSFLDEKNKLLLFSIQEITDILKSERESKLRIEDALVQAEAGNRAKSAFLSQMSHNLRTPMNTILGLVSLTEDDAEHKEIVIDNLSKIKNASTFMLSLINDILDRTMIEENAIILKKEPYHYMEFLEQIRTMFEPLCKEKKIEFSVEEATTAVNVLIDKYRMNQIFFNIFENAVKFTPSGGKISYYTENIELKDGKLSADYIVEDTGIGMSEQFQKTMFDAFSQEDEDENSEYRGNGLGLGFAKHLAELMGGSLSVTSKKGIGTKVTVHLESVLVSENVEINTIEPFSKESDYGLLKGKNILLVEDHPINSEITAKLLKRREMNVTLAENGKEAFEKYSASEFGHYDAILMDIRMPVLDGISSTKMIRELERQDSSTVPIIALTANAYDRDRLETQNAGMNAHLSKPTDSELLYKTLYECIKNTGQASGI